MLSPWPGDGVWPSPRMPGDASSGDMGMSGSRPPKRPWLMKEEPNRLGPAAVSCFALRTSCQSEGKRAEADVDVPVAEAWLAAAWLPADASKLGRARSESHPNSSSSSSAAYPRGRAVFDDAAVVVVAAVAAGPGSTLSGWLNRVCCCCCWCWLCLLLLLLLKKEPGEAAFGWKLMGECWLSGEECSCKLFVLDEQELCASRIHELTFFGMSHSWP